MSAIGNACRLLMILSIAFPSLSQNVPQQFLPGQPPFQQQQPQVPLRVQPDVNVVNDECCRRGQDAETCYDYVHVNHLSNDWNLYCKGVYEKCCQDKFRAIACGKGMDIARQGGDCGSVVESDPHKSDIIGCCMACNTGLHNPGECAANEGTNIADKTFLTCCEEAAKIRADLAAKEREKQEALLKTSETKPSSQSLVQDDPSGDKPEVKSPGSESTASGDPIKAALTSNDEEADGHEAVVAITCPEHQVMDPVLKTCVDTDCKDTSCPEHHTCTVMDGRVSCMTCKPGFQMTDGKCVDVNECDIEEGNECESQGRKCVNTIGGFDCVPSDSETATSEGPVEPTEPPTEETTSCDDGFTVEDGECVDVNECLSELTCMSYQNCENTAGSYKCIDITCETGMKLLENKTCVPQEYCESGFEFELSSEKCIDIDECKNGTACAEGQVCINRRGSFDCKENTCDPGYRLQTDSFFTDKVECQDVDECEENQHNCTSEHQECDNIEGGYRCICHEGYELRNSTGLCEDIDECLNVITCNSSVSTCNNTVGSYDCVCKSGFARSSVRSCTDIDECEENPCKGEARCHNRHGSFECQCLTGFVLQDNTTCVPDGKQRVCNGLQLSNGTCSCPDGFDMNIMDDRIDCHDIDECADVEGKPKLCTSEGKTCVNTFGGHECMDITCPDHYVPIQGRKNWCRHSQLNERCLTHGEKCEKKFRDAATISYNFATVHNNPVMTGPVTLYELWGLPDSSPNAIDLDFINDMVDVEPANPYDRSEYVRDFRVDYDRKKERTTVELVKPITGPQKILIRIDAESRQMEEEFKLIHVAYLNVYVSKYNDHFNQDRSARISKG